jgi:predicted MFS family arabinose efflux permease
MGESIESPLSPETEAALPEEPPPAPLSPPPLPELTTLLLVVFSIGTGLVICNLYYMQPLLGRLMTFFGIDETLAGITTTASQVGYGLGMLLIVPIADFVEKRRLICVLLVLAIVFLLVVVVSNIYYITLAACFCIGACSITPQLLVPIAAQMSTPERRGRAVAALVSGMVVGILVSRVISGFFSDLLGWRTIYWVAAILIFLLMVTLRLLLPPLPPYAELHYLAALRSLGPVFMQLRELRIGGAIELFIFAAFNAFWKCLAYLLRDLFGWGTTIIGLFGLIGVVGALVANVAGRLLNKMGPFLFINVGLGTAIVAYIMVATVSKWLPGLILTIILLDAGFQSANISIQTIVQSQSNEARNRVTAIFIFRLFVGGSSGSALGAYPYQHFGRLAVGIFGIALLTAASITHLLTQLGRQKQSEKQDAAESGPTEDDVEDIREGLSEAAPPDPSP